MNRTRSGGARKVLLKNAISAPCAESIRNKRGNYEYRRMWDLLALSRTRAVQDHFNKPTSMPPSIVILGGSATGISAWRSTTGFKQCCTLISYARRAWLRSRGPKRPQDDNATDGYGREIDRGKT